MNTNSEADNDAMSTDNRDIITNRVFDVTRELVLNGTIDFRNTILQDIFRCQEVFVALSIGIAILVLIIAAVAFIATRPASFRISEVRR